MRYEHRDIPNVRMTTMNMWACHTPIIIIIISQCGTYNNVYSYHNFQPGTLYIRADAHSLFKSNCIFTIIIIIIIMAMTMWMQAILIVLIVIIYWDIA